MLRPYLEKTKDDLLYHGQSINQLARKFGTPFYVYSAPRIRENFQNLRTAFEKYYEKVHICFAIKANSNPHILKLLQQEGAGADCSSAYEIEYAKRSGFDLTQSLFTAVNPNQQDLASAVKGGLIMNLDDLPVFERLGHVPELLSFRVNPGIGSGKFNQIVVGGKGSKFGVPESQALAAYAAAQKKGVKRFGLHMMTGSCILDGDYFVQITQKLLSMAGEIRQQLGIQFEFVDIGGGFGVPYENHERHLDLDLLAKNICQTFKSSCEKYDLGQPTLMMEPGRFFVADAGLLVGQVVHIKQDDKTFLGLDTGMTSLIRPALYGAYHEIINVSRDLGGPQSVYDVVGPICESTDCFAKDRTLATSQVGDLVALLDAGAYGWAMSMSFNGRPRPAEILLDQGQSHLIRRRETVDDILGQVP